MSDGAGEVIAVGKGVTEFKVGDKVISTFFSNWLAGDPDPRLTAMRGDVIAPVPGDTVDGFAAEYVAKPAHAFTLAPKGYTHAEAATCIPLSGVGTACWQNLPGILGQ